MRTNVPRAIRLLRMRARLRQADLAARVGLARDTVSRIERGELDGLSLRSLERITRGLHADLAVEVRWRGADLDRLVDRVHAVVQDAAAQRLTRTRWRVFPEVSFNHYGDRGSCDLVAWHAPSRMLLVVEVKTRIGNLEETLRRLDVKARLGRQLAAELSLPPPCIVTRALVVAESHGARRVIAGHPALFARFQHRGRGAFAWLRTPSGAAGLLWFEQPADSVHGGVIPAERVRRRPAEGSRA
jgi:transcriptional regulator with XRE-family HTH domain